MANADWDLFQSLHAVLQAGSLSAAAKSRGLTQPTLGRHIEALEQKLGAPLFLRSPRGLTPTDLARQLESHLAEMHAAAAAAFSGRKPARASIHSSALSACRKLSPAASPRPSAPSAVLMAARPKRPASIIFTRVPPPKKIGAITAEARR